MTRLWQFLLCLALLTGTVIGAAVVDAHPEQQVRTPETMLTETTGILG